MKKRAKFKDMSYEDLCLLYEKYHDEYGHYPNKMAYINDNTLPTWRRVELICGDRLDEFISEYINKEKKRRNRKRRVKKKIENVMRTYLKEWKERSLEHYGNKCAITGDKYDVIHHIYPFKEIAKETIQSIGLPYKRYREDYTDEQLRLIVETFKKTHNKYDLGVPLTHEIHKEFHNIYGYKTYKDDFEEYKRFKSQGLSYQEILDKKGITESKYEFYYPHGKIKITRERLWTL